MGVTVGGRPAETLETFRDAVRMALDTISASLTGEPSLSEVVAYLERETVPEEREAILAVARLGGRAAARVLLDDRFGSGRLAWLPFRFVRLRPPRELYVMNAFEVAFRADVGWHKVSAELAAACVEANDLERAQVFDVAIVRPPGHVAELSK